MIVEVLITDTIGQVFTPAISFLTGEILEAEARVGEDMVDAAHELGVRRVAVNQIALLGMLRKRTSHSFIQQQQQQYNHSYQQRRLHHIHSQ